MWNSATNCTATSSTINGKNDLQCVLALLNSCKYTAKTRHGT